ncbi:MAG: amino acid adenylation domain-containing protein [Acidobacteriota bacterium]
MVTEDVQHPAEVAAEAEEEVFLFPATYAQERLWFLERFTGPSALFNIPVAYRLRGTLEPELLLQALTAVVHRHEALRTTFLREDGVLQQVVHPAARITVRRVDLSGLAAGEADHALRGHIRQEASVPFDLGVGPLIRARLIEFDDDDHVFALTVHHIVADGWSMGVLFRELEILYAALLEGRHGDLPELAIQYGDYAVWQRENLVDEALDQRVEAWRDRLENVPRLLELPTDRPRPAVQSHRGAVLERALPNGLGQRVQAFATERGLTRFMVLFTAFAAVLHHYTGKDDLVVGTPLANREQDELGGLIGFFANTLPLRLRPVGREPFAQLLARVREVALDVYSQQDVPFDQLVSKLAPDRDPSHNPLLQVMFLIDDEPRRPALPGLKAEVLPVFTARAKYDLALTAVIRGERLAVRADYATDLYDRSTIGRLLTGYEALLTAALETPDALVRDLPVLDAGGRHQILYEWNDTLLPEGLADGLLHGDFERRAAQTPEATAIVCGDQVVRYGELAAGSRRLARHLRSLGVGPGVLVGVHLERSPRMIEAVLGILQAGGVYVPLESLWPAERIRWIVEADEIRHCVAEAATLDRLVEVAAPGELHPTAHALAAVLLGGEDIAGEVPPEVTVSRPDPLASTEALEPLTDAEDIAYIIFTSGSTGKPKGVVVRHRAAINLVRWVNNTYDVGPADKLLFITALSFDLSVYDIFGTLAAGGTIRLALDEERVDPQNLLKIMQDEGITFWDSAPAALQQLVPYMQAQPLATPALRLVFLSGDWIPTTLPDTVREAFPAARVISLGGATEATVWSNFHPIEEVNPDWPSIPYGRPIANARYHVLDRRFRPCPIGVPGDLYISGPCLSMGYARAPHLTAAQYLPDPWTASPTAPAPLAGGEAGNRLYRTGDLARYHPTGILEFLGRSDTQVKLRGFRIELGEIEAVLKEHVRVAEAVALVREDSPGNQRLAVYVRPESAAEPPSLAELHELAEANLPTYMVPMDWVVVDQWPQSATGKLDRKALPLPGPSRPATEPPAESAAETTPPQRPTNVRARRVHPAERIAAVWRKILDVDEIDPEVSFFDQGGNSLTLAEVHVRLQEIFEIEIPMLTLFRHPTVDDLAAALAEELGVELESEVYVDEDELRAEAREAPPGVAAPPPAEAPSREVAVVGLAGRFPGAADPAELWRMLVAGREGVREFTDEELLAAGADPRDLTDPLFVRARGALEEPEMFDAAFFGMTPREAQVLDPQHRLFLEAAWQALEAAGYPPAAAGTGRVGVFAGASENGYGHALKQDREMMAAVGNFQIGLANRADYLPTRVSYELDLRGPSLDVQTACSTSLVTVHLARLALLNGDCDIALAGGVSVQLHEKQGYLYIDGGIDSPDGHTRAFDAAAAGVVGGSGLGVVALKRLDDALADGDTIHAVIKGSALNNDGSDKVGFTAPSVAGQVAVIRAALADANVEPGTIGYVEAHGTATPMGDPIEVAALTEAFGAGLPPASCELGSIKTNIGHLDAAAGITGLIKAVLALREGEVPPSLHFEQPNPEIAFDGTPFKITTERTPWRSGETPRRAGVSSFGIGGTNAHVILEEAPLAPSESPSEELRPAHLLLLSAHSPAALDAAGKRLADHLETTSSKPAGNLLADASFTLSVGREFFPFRRSVVAKDVSGAIAALRSESPLPILRTEGGRPPVAFLFPGQGTQYPGMAAELYAVEERFRRRIDEASEILREDLGFDPREVLLPVGGHDEAAKRLRNTAVTQPVLFAVEHALARLWMDWGVTPWAMIGHSLGEYTAACLAGVFSTADALRLVAARGRLMAGLPNGDMLALALSQEETEDILQEETEISLAAVNGERSCVVSGPAPAIEALAARLEEKGLEPTRLHTSHAFHSAMMDPILDTFATRVAETPRRAPRIPFVSNSTGTWITDREATDPQYWARHLRSAVHYEAGLRTLLEEQPGVLFEVGPGNTLSRLAKQHSRAPEAVDIVSSLPGPARPTDDLESVLEANGRLWTRGVPLDWQSFWAGQHRRRIPLPTYPFERRRYWVDGAEALPTPQDEPAGRSFEEPQGEAENAVAAAFREILGLAEVSRHDDFFDLGGSSLLGVQLRTLVGRKLEVELSAALLLEASTVAAVAAKARPEGGANGTAAPPPSCLVPMTRQRAAGRQPLFLVHAVGGHVFTFRELAAELEGRRTLFALRSRGLESGEEPHRSLAAMAGHYLDLMRAEQGKGPYLLGGASMGGVVAFEMARQLLAAGEKVERLVLMDSPVLDQMPARESNADPLWLVVRDRTGLELDDKVLGDGSLDERFARAAQAVADAGESDRFDAGEALRLARVLEANVEAMYAYRPEPADLRILFFRAAERRPVDPPRPELPWIELGRLGTETVIVPGDHDSMHHAPHLAVMAHHLLRRLP